VTTWRLYPCAGSRITEGEHGEARFEDIDGENEWEVIMMSDRRFNSWGSGGKRRHEEDDEEAWILGEDEELEEDDEEE
jgi:hypothetical protein